MNIPKFLLAVVAVFIFMFFFGYFFHDVLLKETYAQLPAGLSRTTEDFKSHFAWLVVGQIIFALAFACIIVSSSSGVGGGVKYGIKVGILLIGTYLLAYAVHPYSMSIIVYWSIGGLVEMAIAGAIVGAIYKPSTPTAS